MMNPITAGGDQTQIHLHPSPLPPSVVVPYPPAMVLSPPQFVQCNPPLPPPAADAEAAEENKTLWVRDLHYWMEENYLHRCFGHTGEVLSIKVIRNKHTGQSEGYGFIEFYTHTAAEKVLQTFSCHLMPNTDQPFRLNWASFRVGDRQTDAAADHSIFVGDLAADVTDSLLHESFAGKYPSVKGAKVVIDSTTSCSKGYGFVRFGNDNEKTQAMSEMNGGFGSNGSAQGFQSDGDLSNTTVFVRGLDPNASEDELRQSFSQYGEIASVKIPVRKQCGLVQFVQRNNAEEALHGLNGTVIGKHKVRLSLGRNPANKQGSSKTLPRTAQIKLVCQHPEVYEPCDDSFALVDALLADRSNLLLHRPSFCMEIGCGSGYVIASLAIMLGLESPGTHYFATDINPHAVETTRKTLEAHSVHAEVVSTDIASGLRRRLKGMMDVVVVNPPYVPTPEEEVGHRGITCSWAGGENGRRVIDRILPIADELLSEKGWLYIVTLAANNPSEICWLMRERGFGSRIVVQRSTEEESLQVIKFWREDGDEGKEGSKVGSPRTGSWLSQLPLWSFWKSNVSSS